MRKVGSKDILEPIHSRGPPRVEALVSGGQTGICQDQGEKQDIRIIRHGR